VSLLPDDDVTRFVGPYSVPNAVLDTTSPTTQGPFAMPDYYFELRRQQAAALEAALDVLDEVANDFEQLSGRRTAALEAYRLEDATHAIVALGSTAGTVKDVVDELREEHETVGLLKLVSFRPFPTMAVAAALQECTSVAVLDRADSPGGTPPLHAELAAALYGRGVELVGHVYGLGGRDLHAADVRAVFTGAAPSYVGLRGERCPV
jgi:pyruvate ferredoxin oxidoreductase alpha subunit